MRWYACGGQAGSRRLTSQGSPKTPSDLGRRVQISPCQSGFCAWKEEDPFYLGILDTNIAMLTHGRGSFSPLLSMSRRMETPTRNGWGTLIPMCNDVHQKVQLIHLTHMCHGQRLNDNVRIQCGAVMKANKRVCLCLGDRQNGGFPFSFTANQTGVPSKRHPKRLPTIWEDTDFEE